MYNTKDYKENKPNIYWGGGNTLSGQPGAFPAKPHDGSTHLPHLMNTKAGSNRHDPMNRAVFEVSFSLPNAISGQYAQDAVTLTELNADLGVCLAVWLALMNVPKLGRYTIQFTPNGSIMLSSSLL